MPGLVILETPEVLGLVSWADRFQDGAAPVEEIQAAGGGRDSWLPRWTVRSLEARVQFSITFTASILLFKSPRGGQASPPISIP